MASHLIYPECKEWNIDRHAEIISVGGYVPETVFTNQDIIQKYNILATDRAIEYSIGIRERRWADPEALPSELLVKAAQQCIEQANIAPDKINRILYAKMVGDRFVPSTAIEVLRKLKIKKGIPAFDISAACSGFMHALDMAVRYIDAGDDYVLVLAGAIGSKSINKQINKKDTKTIFLLGDGMAAMLVGHSEQKHFIASYLYTDNNYYDAAYIPYGTTLLNNSQADINNEIFNMQMKDGRIVHEATVNSAYDIATRLLKQTNMNLDSIDFFITSDQTTYIWEDSLRKLNIPKEKSLSLFHKYGNTVAAMSPLILNELIITNKLKRGMTVMMMAHGAGSSGGGMIFKY